MRFDKTYIVTDGPIESIEYAVAVVYWREDGKRVTAFFPAHNKEIAEDLCKLLND